ncbi:hypothetical protein SAMN05216589_2160 [Halopseudomonas bauzanensis]|uniref:Uncharacterized protein n=1 Tax=Halopseudomonas bauzanensis TaxID=653930 RepID=A0A1I4MQX9_9GAMM|nr:hypothetical protein SAMN05216589_2160 [Halopseudomonas bauzanensis]SFM05413.1 hypothetical protein SAMN04487855_2159 [Halopseudomonas bauzanensis]
MSHTKRLYTGSANRRVVMYRTLDSSTLECIRFCDQFFRTLLRPITSNKQT